MPIQDSNPERRNLTVTAFSFVIYYLAEGTVVDSVVSLPMINVEFKDVSMLANIAWFTLFWFAFRYWQTTRGKIASMFIGAIQRQNPPRFVQSFVTAHIENVGLTEEEKELRCNFSRTNNKWMISFRPVAKVDVDNDGNITRDDGIAVIETVTEFKAPTYIVLFSIPYMTIRLFKYNFELVSFFVPYLLFILATILGVTSYSGV